MAKKKKSRSDEVFHELRHGNQYERTKKKHGKKTANKQMVAVALKKLGKTKRKKK